MNPYNVLGVSENASQEEIKAAFRSMALKYHPDRNPNNPQAEAKFKEANAAYELIGTPEKRNAYTQQQQSVNFPNFDFNLENMFADLFGGMQGGFNPRRQSSVYKTSVRLTLKETLENKEHTFMLPIRKPCNACKGTAAAAGKPIRCNQCKGAGCMMCGGAGMVYQACNICAGKGFDETPTEVKIIIPKGIFANTQLQSKTKYGAVLTSIHVDYPDNIKLGANGRLIMDVYIPYHVAVLGGIYDIELFDGNSVSVKFPALKNNDQLIKIKGKGIYVSPNSDERGDLFLAPKILIPNTISDEHKTILEQLANLYFKEQEVKHEHTV